MDVRAVGLLPETELEIEVARLRESLAQSRQQCADHARAISEQLARASVLLRENQQLRELNAHYARRIVDLETAQAA